MGLEVFFFLAGFGHRTEDVRNLIKVAKSRAGEKPWPASSQAPCRLLVCWNPALTADRHHAVAWVHGLYEAVSPSEAGIFDVAHLTNSKRGPGGARLCASDQDAGKAPMYIVMQTIVHSVKRSAHSRVAARVTF